MNIIKTLKNYRNDFNDKDIFLNLDLIILLIKKMIKRILKKYLIKLNIKMK